MSLSDWSEDLQDNGVPFIKTTPPGPKSMEKIQEAKKYITSYWTGKKKESSDSWDLPLTVKRVANSLIEDVDGNVYIDLNAGISTANFGYNNPEIWNRAQEIMKEYGVLGIFPSNDYNLPLMIDTSKNYFQPSLMGPNIVFIMHVTGQKLTKQPLNCCELHRAKLCDFIHGKLFR
jgi:hypothetical protein